MLTYWHTAVQLVRLPGRGVETNISNNVRRRGRKTGEGSYQTALKKVSASNAIQPASPLLRALLFQRGLARLPL